MDGNGGLLVQICDDVLPVYKKLLATDDYGVALIGSRSRGTADKDSDYDFTLYGARLSDTEGWKDIFAEIAVLHEGWRRRGVTLDGPWPRTYREVEEQLDAQLAGGEPLPMPWCVWGYQALIVMHTQAIIEDTTGRLRRWKDRLDPYPPSLEKAIVAKHRRVLDYWMGDYHYRHKLDKKDYVFLASLTARLIHGILQILYALNHVYYPGDGGNLAPTLTFALKPEHLEARVVEILYPGGADGNAIASQYEGLRALYGDVLGLLPG